MVEHLAEILDEGLDTFDIKLIPIDKKIDLVFSTGKGKERD